MTTVYLTVVEVLAIHEDQVERFGGSSGVRDPGNSKPHFSARRPATMKM